MQSTKKGLLVLISAMALAAFALPAVASASYQGNDAFWYSDGVACPSNGSVTNPCDTINGHASQILLTASNGLTVQCDLDYTGSVWNTSGTGQDSIDSLTFSNCSSNTPCAVTASANGLPWDTQISQDNNGVLWDEIENVDFTDDLEPVILGCPGPVEFTASDLNLQLTPTSPASSPAETAAVTCPNDPTKTGIEANFLGAGSGTLNGPAGSGVTATASGTAVVCADNETALSVVGSF